ncbi:MAG: hypothetical protein ABIV21_05425 [Pyrinomonadaceae bacterium]
MDPILTALDRQFLSVDSRSRQLLNAIGNDLLFSKPREIGNSMAQFSCGEYILRSAAMVEQAFGGITTRLWDDPYEWTLPEKLSTRKLIIDYFDEVEATRNRGFAFIASDSALFTMIPAPETLRSLFDILLTALNTAGHFQGRAFALMQVLSDEKLPRM